MTSGRGPRQKISILERGAYSVVSESIYFVVGGHSPGDPKAYSEVGSILTILNIKSPNLSQQVIGLFLEFLNLGLDGVYKTVTSFA